MTRQTTKGPNTERGFFRKLLRFVLSRGRAQQIPPKPSKDESPPKARTSAMSAGWKISVTPEDKQSLIVFVRELNDALGQHSNLGISNLSRALCIMVLKRKQHVLETVKGMQLTRPDNNDHAALVALEQSLGDSFAEACFRSVRSEPGWK